MNSTTKWILIGAAVLVGGYLLFSKNSPVKLAKPAASTGGSSWLSAGGQLFNGASNLWDSIFNSGDSSASGSDESSVLDTSV